MAAAAAVIRDQAPDLVTLNKVCRDDVSIIERALAESDHVGATASAFQPARDRRTGEAFCCRDGQPYGIGLVARRPVPDRGFTTTSSGIYPVQDAADPEERAWLCVDAGAFAACTTHLADTSASVAWAQCRYLLGAAVPGRTSGTITCPRYWAGISTFTWEAPPTFGRACLSGIGVPMTAACRTSWCRRSSSSRPAN